MNIQNEIVNNLREFLSSFCSIIIMKPSNRTEISANLDYTVSEQVHLNPYNLPELALRQFKEIKFIREQSGFLTAINHHLVNLNKPAATIGEYQAYQHLLDEINIDKILSNLDQSKIYLNLSSPTLTRVPEALFRRAEIQDYLHRLKIIFVGKNNFNFPDILSDLIDMNKIRVCQGMPN